MLSLIAEEQTAAVVMVARFRITATAAQNQAQVPTRSTVMPVPMPPMAGVVLIGSGPVAKKTGGRPSGPS